MQEAELVNALSVRLIRLITLMVECTENGEKDRLMKLADRLNSDSEDFVALLYDEVGVEDVDVEVYSTNKTNTEDAAMELKKEAPTQPADGNQEE